MIDVAALPKDCYCITHDGAHWLHEDYQQSELNLMILERGGALSFRAFAQAEADRLRSKAAEMRRLLNSGNTEPFVWPEGHSEHDYNARAMAVLKLRDGCNAQTYRVQIDGVRLVVWVRPSPRNAYEIVRIAPCNTSSDMSERCDITGFLNCAENAQTKWRLLRGEIIRFDGGAK